jgi:CHAD domain-containing protein
VRDVEVLLIRLSGRVKQLAEEDRAAAEALLARLSDDHQQKRNELLIVLRSPRYLTLLDQLEEAVEHPKLRKESSSVSRGQWMRVVRGPWRKLRRAARALDQDASPSALHRVRIRTKRCRYAAEAVAHLDGSAARRFTGACQRFLDVLGEHQDCALASAWLRRNAELASSREAYAAGQLAILERKAMATASKARPAAWKALNRRKLRRWFH